MPRLLFCQVFLRQLQSAERKIELMRLPSAKLGTYQTPPSNQPQPWLVWRPKGYLGSRGLALICLLISLTLLMALARLIAAPGMPLADWPLLDILGRFGAILNHSLTLVWVPHSDFDTVIYLLLLPTAYYPLIPPTVRCFYLHLHPFSIQ